MTILYVSELDFIVDVGFILWVKAYKYITMLVLASTCSPKVVLKKIGLGTNVDNFAKSSTLVYPALFWKIGRLVPELEELGYLVKYPSLPSSGTNLPVFKKFQNCQHCTQSYLQVGTRVF